MEDLQKRLEEILILTAESSTDHLIQAVLVAGTSNITKETENALHYLAAWSFVEMAKLPDFQRIPYHQFVILLASCELHVSHELVAADAALLWLVGQPHPAVYVPGVFSVIRSAYLTKVDRQLIIERTATLQMLESVARFARICMESRHSLRICLEGSHINRHLCRCGIPDPETRPKETALSLSRPREGIKWSEKNIEEQKKSKKSRKSRSRSKKRGKDRSRRSSKSSRKGDSSKRRSSRNKKSRKDEDKPERSSRRRREKRGDESRKKRRRSSSEKSGRRSRSRENGRSSMRRRSDSGRDKGGRSKRSAKEKSGSRKDRSEKKGRDRSEKKGRSKPKKKSA
ncbi:hypothetical protein OESDEN_20969 [Oesophagostomum dentatum]|uniref:BACK domain-containing protein n=1 Tax=Oesophagostomum dentatum TaxID=61180 RepID=A0A0B1S820_OESDE|nr:hypothetical protein OESDEN_20969 [Oesophagostomum dentatum]